METEFEAEYLEEDTGNMSCEEEEIKAANDQNDGDDGVFVMYCKEEPDVDETLKPTRGKTRKQTSLLWKHYTKLDKDYALCHYCNTRKKCSTTISNLKSHLWRSHRAMVDYKDVAPERRRPSKYTRISKNRRSELYEMVTETLARCKLCQKLLKISQRSTTNLTTHLLRCCERNGIDISDSSTTVTSSTPLDKHTETHSRNKLHFVKIEEDVYICERCYNCIICDEPKQLMHHTCKKITDDVMWMYFEHRPPGFALCHFCRNEIDYNEMKDLVQHLVRKHRDVNFEFCNVIKSSTDDVVEEGEQVAEPVTDGKVVDVLEVITNNIKSLDILQDEYFKEIMNNITESYELDSIGNSLGDYYTKKVYEIRSVIKDIDSACISVNTWGVGSANVSVYLHCLVDLEKRTFLLKTFTFNEFNHSNMLKKFRHLIECWGLNVAFAVYDKECIRKVFDDLGWPAFECFNSILINSIKVILAQFKSLVSKLKTFLSKVDYSNRISNINPLSIVKVIVDFKNNQATNDFFSKTELVCLKQLSLIIKPYSDIIDNLKSRSFIEASLPIVLISSLLKVSESNLDMDNLAKDIRNALNVSIEHLKTVMGECERNEKLSQSTFLDPRFKTHCFRNESISSQVTAQIENLIKTDDQPSDANINSNKRISVFDTIDDLVQSASSELGRHKQEVDMYLKDALLSTEKCPLEWWKERAAIYPRLMEFYGKNCHMVANCRPCCDVMVGNAFDRCVIKRKYRDMVLFLHMNKLK